MKIVVLGGGLSTERAVSLVSATSVCKALRSIGHRAVFVDLFLGLAHYNKPLEGIFDEPDGLCEEVCIDAQVPDLEQVKRSRQDQSASRVGEKVFEVCKLADCVYLGLHGADGEDGKIQAALELLGIPYTGSGPLGSALAMDKAIAKVVMSAAGIRTPGWQEYTVNQARIQELKATLHAPCVIKASNGGSSIGVYMCYQQHEVTAALDQVWSFGEKIIVEDLILGREFTVPVIDQKALVPIEIIPPENGKFDYISKYQSGAAAAQEICPAQIDALLKQQLQEAALNVHKALGLEVISRSDFIVDNNNKIWCLEVNTLPGMTPSSLIPKAAKVEGIDYAELCNKVVEDSMRLSRLT